jgi:CO/xanthine dehydrogenase FAD-binding subunit
VKPVAFDYLRPASVDEAVASLSADPEARVIAGGQTLVPMLAMRLSRPSVLVDVTRIAALDGITEAAEGVEIGAVTRQAVALHSDLIRWQVPLLAKALSNVGHPPTRARGTVGGSIAHGDPSAEIALAATVLGARIIYLTEEGEEEFLPEEYFLGPTVTSAPMGGLLTRIIFPKRPEGRVGAGFAEIASRRSDYAFASAGAQIVMEEDGTCRSVHLGIGAVGDVPVALDVTELVGTRPVSATIRSAVADALQGLDCISDLHATASYRLRAAARLAENALAEAISDASDASKRSAV